MQSKGDRFIGKHVIHDQSRQAEKSPLPNCPTAGILGPDLVSSIHKKSKNVVSIREMKRDMIAVILW